MEVEKELNVSVVTDLGEPIAESEETTSQSIATEDLFAVSASYAANNKAADSVHQSPPNRPDAPIVSKLLQQLLEYDITDLATSFELQALEQSPSIELRNAILALRDQIDQMLDRSNEASPLATFAPTVLGASLTAGIVTWVLRSGLLLSATITATPLWRPLDPVPILARSDDDEPWYESGAQSVPHHRTTVANVSDTQDRHNPGIRHG